MTQNIIEYDRELSVKRLFNIKKFADSWEIWNKYIRSEILHYSLSETSILSIGDYLRDVFYTTNSKGRSQSILSTGGSNWEALVCWYLNLCRVNRRTIIIKHNKELLPTPISDAITVNYGSFRSNTESDLIAITFPDKDDYRIDKEKICIPDQNNQIINCKGKTKYNYLPIMNGLVFRDFPDLEVHIIQCKTNWNDNAQIPMLWDAVYSAEKFKNNISVGCNGYSIHDVKKFSYSFVTVPTNKSRSKKSASYKIDLVPVLRVKNLSGGNYWGQKSKNGVASSVKEMVERNLKTGAETSILSTLKDSLTDFDEKFSYFRIE